MENFIEQIDKRRTFAIISHPDAGKTTLTEKLLEQEPGCAPEIGVDRSHVL